MVVSCVIYELSSTFRHCSSGDVGGAAAVSRISIRPAISRVRMVHCCSTWILRNRHGFYVIGRHGFYVIGRHGFYVIGRHGFYVIGRHGFYVHHRRAVRWLLPHHSTIMDSQRVYHSPRAALDHQS
jgi:hypothetical protein